MTVDRCPKCGYLVLPGRPCGQCKVARSARSKRNRQQGETTQDVAARALAECGIAMVERVHTPWKVIRATKNGRRVIVGAVPLEKVGGDLRGVAPGGRSVLAEVKSRTEEGRDDVLRWSDLEKHQRLALTAHAAAYGLSIVAWVRLEPVVACYLLPWDLLQALGFRAGQSIDTHFAEIHTLRPGQLDFARVPAAPTSPTLGKVPRATTATTTSPH